MHICLYCEIIIIIIIIINVKWDIALLYITLLTHGQSQQQCSNPTDLSCLKNWSGCVKRSDEAAYGRVSYTIISLVFIVK